jgi:hypothetical protein
VRGIKLTSPLKVDGRLDDEIYTREQPFGGLIQVAPNYGEAQTERSDVWIMYDDRAMYVTCRCWDSAPPGEWIVNELRRDTNGLRQNDHFGVMFDTYYDRRSGFAFYTNPLGARADYSIVDEGGSQYRLESRLDVEDRPFRGRVDRRNGDSTQVASVSRRRESHLGHAAQTLRAAKERMGVISRRCRGASRDLRRSIRISAAGTLVGLDLPEAGKNLEIKPYGVSRMTTDRVRTPPTSNQLDGDVGGDIKYGSHRISQPTSPSTPISRRWRSTSSR